MFNDLTVLPPDALLALIKLYAADPRDTKIDLGVGVYRDASGATPVFKAVKKAEMSLLASQDSKAYLGPEGDMGMVEGLMPYAFGDVVARERLTGIQTPGGTGAVRLACDLLKSVGVKRVLLGTPSWPNHAPIIKAAGMEVVTFEHGNIDTQSLTFDALLTALDGAGAGDAVLLHGCCHNPTGMDYSAEQWVTITDKVLERGIFPLIDLAYQGLGAGFDEDAAGMRGLLARVPEALIAYSCDKNFGVYRDRVGAIYGMGKDADAAAKLFSHFNALARANWSMPPDHGGAVVRMILQDPELTAMWQDEVTDMRARLSEVRVALGAAGAQGLIGTVNLAAAGAQKGMFSTLKLTPGQIKALREDHGVYMAGSGRINIAGFTLPQVAQFVEALKAVA